jgi:LAO/AO transport system kinase
VKPFFVYMLRCADGSYYVGHSDDMERRLAQHQAGEVEGCSTRQRRPVELVWSQETQTRDEALAAERQLKGWSRAKKEALIRGEGEGIRGLAIGGLAQQVPEGDRRALAKAITLIESTRADHRRQADALLDALMPRTGGALRIGISGVPGVGKSTFIEALGLHLIAQGHRVAVLAVDPSSSLSGGSILGDKTRMERLSVEPRAFIRPSPTSGALGGVAAHTREALLMCEAAGFDIVIVETVGVGQSETAVAGMTDLFVLMQLPNAGDDLQAIKRGVMELADLVLINKSDIDEAAATRAQAMIASALRIFGGHGRAGTREVPVLKLSAATGQGIEAFWHALQDQVQRSRASGAFETRRRSQRQAWLWDLVQSRLLGAFRQHPAVRKALGPALADVEASRTAPTVAARALLALFESAT